MLYRRVSSRHPFEIPLNGFSLTIPADYIGIHAHKFPTNPSVPASPDPAPRFRYGAFRCHDGAQGKFLWSRLNPSNGVYDWTHSDAYINYYHGQGKSVCFTLVSTPTWAATTADLDPYGIVGGGSPPTSQVHVSTFITQLVTRYLGKIKWLEIWNEPNFVVGSFWQGTAAQLATLSDTVRMAAKAVDPNINILSPGLNNITTMDSFLTAQDPTSLNFGHQVIDGLAFHPYNSTALVFDALNMELNAPRVQRARFAVAKVGSPGMPVFATESGISGTPADQTVTDFYALPTEARKARNFRMLAINAALGVQALFLYSYGTAQTGLSGDLVNDTNGAAAGVDAFYPACGRTFTAGSITQNRVTGVVTMRASDGWHAAL